MVHHSFILTRHIWLALMGIEAPKIKIWLNLQFSTQKMMSGRVEHTIGVVLCAKLPPWLMRGREPTKFKFWDVQMTVLSVLQQVGNALYCHL